MSEFNKNQTERKTKQTKPKKPQIQLKVYFMQFLAPGYFCG